MPHQPAHSVLPFCGHHLVISAATRSLRLTTPQTDQAPEVLCQPPQDWHTSRWTPGDMMTHDLVFVAASSQRCEAEEPWLPAGALLYLSSNVSVASHLTAGLQHRSSHTRNSKDSIPLVPERGQGSLPSSAQYPSWLRAFCASVCLCVWVGRESG